MKKVTVAFFALLALLTFQVRADEGIVASFVYPASHVDMQKEGLHLTAEEIYSINHSSLKDAGHYF
ncbi:MAG: hypothetical protein U0Z17_09190 [Bacteroidales bacterium]